MLYKAALIQLTLFALSNCRVPSLREQPDDVAAPLSTAEFFDSSYQEIELLNSSPCSTPTQPIGEAADEETNVAEDEMISDDADGIRQNAVLNSYRLWPNNEVPYTISSKYDRGQRSLIAHAIKEFHRHTCIRFVPRHKHKDYVHIYPGNGCFSHVGRTGRDAQILSLGAGCMRKGIAMHELMHAVGFNHEHTRSDRDSYVRILWENLKMSEKSNFDIDEKGNLFGEGYDYSSIMHYDSNAFSVNGHPTIVAKRNGGHQMGQRDGFSSADVRKINSLYGCNRSRSKTGTAVVLKASNGKYVSSNNGEWPLTADRDEPHEWERFQLEPTGSGKFALKAMGKYCSSENGQGPMHCNRPSVDDWERFEWINHGDDSISIRCNNGKYVSSENGGHMTCNRDGIDEWEKFKSESI